MPKHSDPSNPSATSAQTLRVTVGDLSRAGSGIARDATGRVLFIPLTVPGDEVQVRIIRAEKRYAEAEVVEWLSYSPDRVAPRCSVFGKCGGCTWQMVPYALQWKTKWQGGMHALAKRGLGEGMTPSLFPADSPYQYRNRVQLRGEGGKIGYFARRSHELVEIDRCEIALEPINAALPRLRVQWPVGEQQKLELEILPDGQLREVWNARHGAAGFRQVHSAQNEHLQKWIRTHLRARGPILDLFGGDANLSKGIAAQVESVQVVDLGVPNVRDPALPETLRFHRSPVLPWLKKYPGTAQAAILDPPRSGLADDLPGILIELNRIGVKEVIAVGCDLDAWARDVAGMVKKGWRLEQVAFLDFFPQTPHFESVAHLFV